MLRSPARFRAVLLGATLLVAPFSRAQAELSPLVDRVAVIFDAPETGGAASPRTILERELSFEARLEALATGESLGDERGPYGAKHVRAALDRHIATELLAALPDEIAPRSADPCDTATADVSGVDLARSILLARVKGDAALREAMAAERMTDDDVLRVLRREARAARYLDRVVAPMLAPSDGELRAALRSPSHPLADKPFAEVRCTLRSNVVGQRLGLALASFLQTSRLRVHVRNALP